MVPTPVQLIFLLRPKVKIGILLAVGFSILAFVSTPFLLPVIADLYNVSLGIASMIGVSQLGGFVIATWSAGRWMQPREKVFVVASLTSSVANLVSVFLPVFPLLILLRFITGLALGLLAWYGWVQAFGSSKRMSDVAMAGPVVGVVAAPFVSALLEVGGPRLVFVALGVVSLIPLAFGYRSDVSELPIKASKRHHAVPAAFVLLICLGLFTLGGSAVFVYVVVLGTRLELSVALIAAGLSLNAIVGIPASRWKTLRKFPGLWIAATAVFAAIMPTTNWPWLFLTSMIVWGFFFWVAIPGVFELLASRSHYPEERVGDAQAIMASGRTVGPLLGGLLIDGPGTTALGIVASALMLASAIGVLTIKTITRPQSED